MLQVKSSQTLTYLSQPLLTMSELFGFGEKRTCVTQSECPSSTNVYLQSPITFHNLMVLSREPETICL